MRVEQMFAEGKYMVIYLNHEVLTKDDLGLSLWDYDTIKYGNCPLDLGTPGILDQWRSLIVVTGSPYRLDDEKDSDKKSFPDKVREYNKLEPFKFPSKNLINISC